MSELDAAGITDPALRLGYRRCRALNAAHGKSYFLATLLLPPPKRPYVHALYGFARYADEIVDGFDATLAAPDRARRFAHWSDQVRTDLDRATSADPVGLALIDTVQRWRIPLGYIGEFLESMRMDLTVNRYETRAELLGYMRGSAAVIGLQMLPILGRTAGAGDAELADRASDLGVAFQLTNFLRDIGEDLRRGRIYLPQQSLRAFGVTPGQLERGIVDDAFRAFMAAEIARTRQLYERAAGGIELVHPTSRPCLRAAFTLYQGILDEIARAGYDVLSGRVSVGAGRRVRVAGRGLVTSWTARARSGRADRPDRPGRADRRPSATQIDSVDNTSANPNSRSSTGA